MTNEPRLPIGQPEMPLGPEIPAGGDPHPAIIQDIFTQANRINSGRIAGEAHYASVRFDPLEERKEVRLASTGGCDTIS